MSRMRGRGAGRRAMVVSAVLCALAAACTDPVPDASARDARGAAVAAEPGDRVVVQGVDLTTIGYGRGTPGAPVTVVEFSDFGCPYCAQMALEAEPVLMREFVETGQVYWHYVPFVVGMFPNGDEAARAAECAAEQGRFWEMKDTLYAAQRRWKGASDAGALLAQLASSAVVDRLAWARCYAGAGGRERTERANAAAAQLGVRATPTFFINGQRVQGAIPLAVFRGGLRQMLQQQ